MTWNLRRSRLLGAPLREKRGTAPIAMLAIGLSLSACGGGGGGSGGNDDGEDPAPDYDWSVLRSTLDSYVPDTVSGYAFNLNVDDVSQFTQAGGDISVDSSVLTASATKAPSAAAILTLVDLALLDLDEPVETYLQDSIDWPFAKRSITMRMLLNHTSGLQTDPDCLSEAVTVTMQECVQEIADAALGFLPGTAFSYGGGSYQVAGYIATVLSGQTWNDFFDMALAEPLDMPSYQFFGDENPRVAGGGTTTADDYRHFQQMFLNGGVYEGRQVLSADIIAEMSTDQIAGRLKVGTPLDRNDFPGYAFGWWISSPELHPGSTGPELSDPGLFGAVPWLDLDLNYSAVSLILSDTDTGLDIFSTARGLILDELLGTEESAQP